MVSHTDIFENARRGKYFMAGLLTSFKGVLCIILLAMPCNNLLGAHLVPYREIGSGSQD